MSRIPPPPRDDGSPPPRGALSPNDRSPPRGGGGHCGLNTYQPILCRIHGWSLACCWLPKALGYFFFIIRHVLKSKQALGQTAWTLPQCCKPQCCHATAPVVGGKAKDLDLQCALVHGSAVGTTTPKHP